MIEKRLSVQDFKEYFENNRLGRLYLPNGNSAEILYPREGISLELKELFKLMSGWKIKDESEVPFDDILAVIAYGSAIRYPGYELVPETRLKYLLFGPEIETGRKVRIDIDPRDVDFFVLTESNITRHESIAPQLMTYSPSAGDYTATVKAGINLVNRGVSQLLRGINEGDTISISAMREGIPVFYDERLDEVQRESGITRVSLRKLFWNENENGYLIGKIE